MSRENRKPRDPLHTDYTPWFPKQHSQQAEGRDLTLLKHVCQEGGETGQAGGGRERGEKKKLITMLTMTMTIIIASVC